MNPFNQVPAKAPAAKPDRNDRRMAGLALAILALAVGFVRPLCALVRLALQDDLYSHIALVPIISLYLIWARRRSLPRPAGFSPALAAIFILPGLAVLGYWLACRTGAEMAREDSLALAISSFLLLGAGLAGLFLGWPPLRAVSFPLGFLVFMIPIPTFLLDRITLFLQYGSAAAAGGLFALAGAPVYYHDLVFQLPGINLRVASECSGIHSTLALFITSLLAGHFFLRSRWKRAVLILAVIVLGLLRNGLRIFTIGELCAHFGPEMINSYIHRHGGPLFFVLSLVPLFLLLFLLMRFDRTTATPNADAR
jgi:exosortase C (VPDSG-CTERM-specific)